MKLSTTVGLKFEFTLFSQLKLPDLISIEKNWFLLFEKNKSFLSVIMSDVSNEKADSSVSYTHLTLPTIVGV